LELYYEAYSYLYLQVFPGTITVAPLYLLVILFFAALALTFSVFLRKARGCTSLRFTSLPAALFMVALVAIVASILIPFVPISALATAPYQSVNALNMAIYLYAFIVLPFFAAAFLSLAKVLRDEYAAVVLRR